MDKLNKELDSILEFEEVSSENFEMYKLLDILNNKFNEIPKPFKDCLNNDLEMGSLVLYSDNHNGPRPGIIMGFDESGDFCSISYIGDEADCVDIFGAKICKELTSKCLLINNNKLKCLYGEFI